MEGVREGEAVKTTIVLLVLALTGIMVAQARAAFPPEPTAHIICFLGHVGQPSGCRAVLP